METEQDSPPPWEVLNLISQYLDPKALALASCVCNSWSAFMSSNNLWEPICQAHFSSMSNLHNLTAVPYRRLYSIASAAAIRRQLPSKPRLSLDDLVFTVNVSTKRKKSSGNNNADVFAAVSKPIRDLAADGVFKFAVEVANEEKSAVLAAAASEVVEAVEVVWNVVLEGWSGVFTMMDCEGKMGLSAGCEGWFSAELPTPACFSGIVGSGIVADLKIGFGGGGRVEKVSVGMLNVVNWRYVSVEDGLRYLDHFLLPL
ncbi:probable F-box protein At5g04010 [Humulus lupulus]|uniref:probable F-box protein At5g04010 n=1 Tax=Humulus lupulus TaxID=3486 RepID=UPI002B4093C7|nr:probable F-box protein At5g04010 [Humulus lupulus]